MADNVSPGRDDSSPSFPRDEIRTTVDTVVAAGQLLASPRKCKIWHETWLHEGLDIKGLTEVTPIPQSTLYNLTKEMVEEGSLYPASSADTRATVYKPSRMQIFVSEHPKGIGPQFNIHSTLIGVLGRGVDSGDVETFLDRNNYTILLEAITGVLVILDDPDTEATSLEELFEHMSPVDARLIQGHISAVLKREARKNGIDWEFPEDPVIEPAELPSAE
ncbi:MAG: hypothetical protein V5A46_10660 [Haloferacaceae archaeon]